MSHAENLIQQLDDAQSEHRHAVASLETQLDAIRTELRITTENLAKREARLSQIINTANDAFLSTDISGVIKEWNQTAEQLFGWSSEDMIGKPIALVARPAEAYEPADGQTCLTAILSALGEQQRGEIIGVHRDGRHFPVETSISVMVDEESFIFNAFIHDISERYQMQQQLNQSQKLESIGQLAAGIAHEINTPTQYIGDNIDFLNTAYHDLTNLIGQYQKLLGQAKQGEVDTESIESIQEISSEIDLDFIVEEAPGALEAARDGVARITKIVAAMKDFAHPGSELLSPANLNKALTSTATVCQSEWRHIAELATELDETLPLVPCLPSELNQVFLNIIVNAAHALSDKYTDPHQKGRITITTTQTPDHAVIKIADNGPGIPEEIRSKIFDPFFTTKEVGKGSGQGLSIARSVIVDKHQGELSVDSQPNDGTTFTIKIPLHANQAAA